MICLKLTPRQQQILSAIVEMHIQTGEPVGSKIIRDVFNINVSPATIRSEMANLYDWGYLEQPHTSAGRVPSHVGYREYVDSLMRSQALLEAERDKIESLFNVRNPDMDNILSNAADALSEYTGYTAITSSVVPKEVKVKQIELVIAGKNTVVIILIATNGVIRNKVCRVGFTVTEELVDFFNKFSHSRFVGHSIEDITSTYISSVSLTLGEYSQMFTTILVSIYELCREVADDRFYISGATKLLAYKEIADVAADVMVMLENKDQLRRMFDYSEKEMQIRIGKENPTMELKGLSVTMTHYYVGQKPAGIVGLISPVRINYSRIIPHLQYFSKMLGDLMSDTLEYE